MNREYLLSQLPPLPRDFAVHEILLVGSVACAVNTNNKHVVMCCDLRDPAWQQSFPLRGGGFHFATDGKALFALRHDGLLARMAVPIVGEWTMWEGMGWSGYWRVQKLTVELGAIHAFVADRRGSPLTVVFDSFMWRLKT
jgi:hypothetical protein